MLSTIIFYLLKKIEVDIDRERALQILHDKLRARGAEVFYKQPHTELTHAEAAKWLEYKITDVFKSLQI